MPYVSLLLIDDDVVGPHLRLLRQVCEPFSTSKPHITVRFFERLQIPEVYRQTRVTHVDLIDPGVFAPSSADSRRAGSRKQHTVFIRCKSDDLAPLEHKPDFPGSNFHITIYDGASIVIARGLLHELKKFRWGIQVPLPSTTRLTIKQITPPDKRKAALIESYDAKIAGLFRKITSEELSRSFLISLCNRKRLQLCKAILKSLFRATSRFERVSSPRVGPLQEQIASVTELSEVHLTPPELARDIASYAVSHLDRPSEPIDFGDPAVGTGAFFAALLQLVPKERIASAIGVDINSEQVEAARWRWADKGMRVLIGDYLHMDRLPDRTLILANPPYLRHQSIPPEYKEKLLERASVRTEIKTSARSGLYVYFPLLAHDWMREGALAAWLIPSEFMRSIYGSAVRRYLTEKVELLRVHVYVPQFENVQVYPAVIFFRKQKPEADHSVLMTTGGGLRAPEFQETVSIRDLRESPTWNIPILSKKQNEDHRLSIDNLFIIRRGMTTGANEFFLMTRERARKLGIPKFALKPIIPKVRSLRSDVLEGDPDGYPQVFPQLCVVDCELPEATIRARYPTLMRFLNGAKKLGILKRRLLTDRRPWYKQEHREPPLFLCTYMGRGSVGMPPLRFIWNKSQAIATNTYLLMYPRPRLAAFISQHPEFAGVLFASLKRAAVAGIHDYARVHAGGLFKIEPRELSRVAITMPPETSSEAFKSQMDFFID
jgi:adenine-specific DNA-methyltransferase